MEEQIVQLDPSDVLADDNSRYGLKGSRIEALAANILTTGGVLQPVEVAEIEGAKKAPRYRLTSGFYRHSAVNLLNTRDKAGLTLPAIVRTPADAGERLMHQISENVEREDMSPMDTAVAIKRLLDVGMSKPDVRKVFAREGRGAGKTKGKNGSAVQAQPLSNAMLNIYLAFLALPKAIQAKIHDGAVGVAAAYELGKVPAEKRQAVLERAEAERAAEVAKEEKDEERYLLSQKKAEEAKVKADEAVKAVEGAKDEIVLAEKKVAEKTQDLRTVQAQNYDPSNAAAKSAYMEKLKAAENDLKAAQKLGKDVKNRLAKALEVKNKAEETAAAKLSEAEGDKKEKGKAGRGKSGAVGPKEVQKAAKAEGATTGYTPLTLAEIRDAVKELAAGKVGADDRTVLIAKEFKSCFDGVHTPKMLAEAINMLLDKMGAALPKKPEAAKK